MSRFTRVPSPDPVPIAADGLDGRRFLRMDPEPTLIDTKGPRQQPPRLSPWIGYSPSSRERLGALAKQVCDCHPGFHGFH